MKEIIECSMIWVYRCRNIEWTAFEGDVWFRSEDIAGLTRYIDSDFAGDARLDMNTRLLDYCLIDKTMHRVGFIPSVELFLSMRNHPNEHINSFPDWFKAEVEKVRNALLFID
jgi:hypothetical protein